MGELARIGVHRRARVVRTCFMCRGLLRVTKKPRTLDRNFALAWCEQHRSLMGRLDNGAI